MLRPSSVVLLINTLLFSAITNASDLEREQRIGEQIVDAIF